MTYPIPPPTSGAVTKFQPNVARCTFRTPPANLPIPRLGRILRLRSATRLWRRIGGHAHLSPRTRSAATKFTGANLPTRPRVSRRLGRLGEKNGICPHLLCFSAFYKASAANKRGYSADSAVKRRRDQARKNFRKFIEKPREFIDIYRIFRKFRIHDSPLPAVACALRLMRRNQSRPKRERLPVAHFRSGEDRSPCAARAFHFLSSSCRWERFPRYAEFARSASVRRPGRFATIPKRPPCTRTAIAGKCAFALR